MHSYVIVCIKRLTSFDIYTFSVTWLPVSILKNIVGLIQRNDPKKCYSQPQAAAMPSRHQTHNQQPLYQCIVHSTCAEMEQTNLMGDKSCTDRQTYSVSPTSHHNGQ